MWRGGGGRADESGIERGQAAPGSSAKRCRRGQEGGCRAHEGKRQREEARLRDEQDEPLSCYTTADTNTCYWSAVLWCYSIIVIQLLIAPLASNLIAYYITIYVITILLLITLVGKRIKFVFAGFFLHIFLLDNRTF